MFALSLAVLASAWVVDAQADNVQYHPHGAFAFIRSGEHTPVLGPGPQTLTALGAQQMFTLGENYRARYISANGGAGLGRQNMANMSVDVLNNEQISVQTPDSPHLIASAQAFMQGLYPPHLLANASRGGGDSTGLLADGTAVDYPLNGYQYASVQTYGADAFQSIYFSAQQCPLSKVESLKYLASTDFLTTKAASDDMYQSLDLDWFGGQLEKDQL
jgi:hypothetical protein